MDKQFCVYIMAKDRNSTFYTGMTSNLKVRIWKHKEETMIGFTKKYNIKKLVWYEFHDNAEAAILKEKRLKKWNRPWKMRIIEEMNPDWKDLYETL